MCLITAQWDEAASPRDPEGSFSLPVAIFCLCASPHPFHPPIFLPFGFFSEQRCNQRGARFWEMYCLRWCKKCVGERNCVHLTWNDALQVKWTESMLILHAQKQHIQLFVSSTGPFYNMTPEERIDADNRSVYVGNVRLVYLFSSYWACVYFIYFFPPTLLIWHAVKQIPGRLRSYRRWAGDPFQWLWSCQPSYHLVWQVLWPSQGVGSTCAYNIYSHPPPRLTLL